MVFKFSNMSKLFTVILVCFVTLINAQQSKLADQEKIQELYQQFRVKEIQDSILALNLAQKGSVKIGEIAENGERISLVRFEPNGFPVFYATDNSNASATVGTNLVVAGATNGYGLTGNGMVIGEWDGGSVLGTHQELTGRVTQIDNPSSLSDHSTHVAGTMIASGVVANAKGMATAANISAYDFYNDDSEMTAFSATGIISNHSYGRITGWRNDNGTWKWYGDTAISGVEDYMFGFYSLNARSWDLIANAAPNYLIVKSAGNDRNDELPASVTSHEIYDNGNWIVSTVSRPADGGTDGYDCISSSGNAKNILTVGAVGDIPGGWSQASDVNMSSFSGWGPTDDGRIKPDIVANGVSLYSSGKSNNTDYYSSSGTSMSAPNATGSMALLQEMYNDSNNVYMNASSLKALVIHTANEAGLVGPDFKFGWGLLNVKGAADLIADTSSNRILEASLTNNSIDTYTFYSDGTTDIEATIVWNDPAHSLIAASLDPTTSMLVNDLDLRVSNGTGTIKTPWIANGTTPSVAATKGDNTKDNVENVIFDSPSIGIYTFTVSHKGSLAASQSYSLIISGIQLTPVSPPPTPTFTVTATSICEGDSVIFTDTSTGNPTSVNWTFQGGSPATSASSNPGIVYATAGSYTVKLFATNINGTDSLIQNNFITVTAPAVVTTTSLADVCMSSGSVALSGGLPTGGTWSGTGVSSGAFDPMAVGIGVYALTYTVVSGACTTSASESIAVVSPPTPIFPAFAAGFCDNSTPFLLSGATPAGGVYSGPGVTSNIFSAAVAGIGSHALTYTYTDPSGCIGSAISAINVLPGVATSLGAFADVCADAAILTLTGGVPLGGYYTGLGVDTAVGTFNAIIAGTGIHTITYFGSGGVCLSASTSTITVNALPTVSLVALSSECLSTTSVTLSGGTPIGGTYSGTAITSGVFNPSTAGLGTHWVYYSYTDPLTSCSGIDSASVNVVNNIQSTISDTTVCENQVSFILSSGSPSGGIYSGIGIVANTFDPAIAGVGVYTITYTNVVNSCAISGTAVFTVDPLPSVILAPFNSICLTGGSVTLSGGLPLGGVYSGVGITNNILDPAVNGTGTMTITYSYTQNGCSNSATQLIDIDAGSPGITNIRNSYCVNENSVPFLGSPSGGTYSGSGIIDSIFDPNQAGVGIHAITYTTTGACAGTTSYSVQVNPKPTVGAVSGPLISSQNSVASYTVNPQNGAYYNWSITGGSMVTNSNNQITVNWDSNSVGLLQVVIYDPNGCSDTAKVTVELWPVGVADVWSESGIQLYPNPVQEYINFKGLLKTQSSVELQIFDITGQQVWYQELEVSNGESHWKVAVNTWSSGSYFYVLKTESEIIQKGEFIKQ
ncbi:MAG: PKD repeat protein [Dokdonia sp.]|jgi:PKD repeat protein